MKKELFWLMALSLLIVGCDERTDTVSEKQEVKIEEEKFKQAKVEVKIKRLEREMFAFKSKADIALFLERNPIFVRDYFEVPNAHKEAPFIDQLYDMYTNEKLKEFYRDNEKFYGNMDDLKTEMNSMFSYIKYYYPDYYVPEINTLVTGFRFDRDFSFSDSLIVIGLDYFMGSNARYRPQFYDYMLLRYEKQYIVPMMGLAITKKFNDYDDKDETMLAEMIYYGKAHYYLERVLPTLPDSINIQFSGKELTETNQNVDVIWGHFVEKKLLFDTNHKTKQRYIGESPGVVAIGDNCPGRIGRWLGWQIVRKYMKENPEITLQDLMKNKNAADIFKKSKFKVKAK